MMLKPPTLSSTSTQLLLPDIIMTEEQTLTEHMSNDADTTLKSINFAKSLKTYGCISYKERIDHPQQKTVNDAVVQFNVMAYLDKCSSGSPHYDASFKLDIIASEVFKGGEVWANRELVKDASRELNEDGDSRSGESNKNECYDSSSDDDDGTTMKQLREDYEARERKIGQHEFI